MSTLLTIDDLNQTGWNPPVSWFVSRVCWREVGRRLVSNPEVLQVSRQFIRDSLESGDYQCSPKYLRDWSRILDQGLDSVVQVLTSPDDGESQVLRSCTPLPIRRLLPPHVREEILVRVRKEVEKIETKK